MKQRFSFLLATFFGVGYAKAAPGTIGSLVTLPLAFVLAYFHGLPGIVYGTLAAFVIGVLSVKEVLKQTPHDPSFVVIDEVAGQLMTFAAVASHLQGNWHAWPLYLCGFILFRIFDIFKPRGSDAFFKNTAVLS